MVYNLFNKKFSGKGINSKVATCVDTAALNEQLADKLHKPIIRKFQKHKVNSSFMDNIRGADIADIKLLSR